MARRDRPHIHATNEYIARVEYLMCAGVTCRNVIAAWTKQRFCSRCRSRRR